jgi:hypothetical protein
MSYGTWGSRLPIGNFLLTALLLLGVSWRLRSRRFVNRLRRAICGHPVQLVNDESTSEALGRWVAAGYDRLNIGGGFKALAGFINLDFVPHPRVDREIQANILDLSFIPSASFAHVHSNHVLEHLTREQIVDQLCEYHRILRQAGLLTLRCPNALGAAYAFWFDPVYEDHHNAFLSLGYPPDENFGNPDDGWLHKDLYGLLHWFYGDVGNIENQHLSLITPTFLRDVVERAGFDVLLMSAPEALNLVLVARKSDGRDPRARNLGNQLT